MTKKILIDEAVVKEALFRLNGWAQAYGCNADTDACDDLREALEVNNKGVNALAREVARIAGIMRDCGRYVDTSGNGQRTLQSAAAMLDQAPTQQLTDEQIGEIGRNHEKFDKAGNEWFDRWAFARAIEQAQGIAGSKT